jgi:hypothetical protein
MASTTSWSISRAAKIRGRRPCRRDELRDDAGPVGRKAGVEHDVINAGDAPVSFVEIELKRQPG